MPKGDAEHLRADLGDGWARVANLLLEALSCAPLSASEFRVVMFAIRRTYGWARKHRPQSNKLEAFTREDVSRATGLPPGTVASAIARLQKMGILTAEVLPTQVREYGINPDVAGWGDGQRVWGVFASTLRDGREFGLFGKQHIPGIQPPPAENSAGLPTENSAGLPTENSAGLPTENSAGPEFSRLKIQPPPAENSAGQQATNPRAPGVSCPPTDKTYKENVKDNDSPLPPVVFDDGETPTETTTETPVGEGPSGLERQPETTEDPFLKAAMESGAPIPAPPAIPEPPMETHEERQARVQEARDKLEGLDLQAQRDLAVSVYGSTMDARMALIMPQKGMPLPYQAPTPVAPEVPDPGVVPDPRAQAESSPVAPKCNPAFKPDLDTLIPAVEAAITEPGAGAPKSVDLRRKKWVSNLTTVVSSDKSSLTQDEIVEALAACPPGPAEDAFSWVRRIEGEKRGRERDLDRERARSAGAIDVHETAAEQLRRWAAGPDAREGESAADQLRRWAANDG